MSANGQAEESPQQESPQQGIQSIEVDAQVLRALEGGRGPMALSEVARNCAMHPAKVHRYLVSLVRAGLASQDARTGRYDLGPAVLATQQARQETHTPGAAALEKLLVKTRRDGIASWLHRMIYGMAAFGAPVFGPDRGPRARDRPRHARPPDGRGPWGEADRLADALRSTAGQISAELGYRPA
jgi:DNA-binding IclR family transcriptional regulator